MQVVRMVRDLKSSHINITEVAKRDLAHRATDIGGDSIDFQIFESLL